MGTGRSGTAGSTGPSPNSNASLPLGEKKGTEECPLVFLLDYGMSPCLQRAELDNRTRAWGGRGVRVG